MGEMQRDVAGMATSKEITKSGSADIKMTILSMQLIKIYNPGAITIESYE